MLSEVNQVIKQLNLCFTTLSFKIADAKAGHSILP
jgi:hypothetical protein